MIKFISKAFQYQIQHDLKPSRCQFLSRALSLDCANITIVQLKSRYIKTYFSLMNFPHKSCWLNLYDFEKLFFCINA